MATNKWKHHLQNLKHRPNTPHTTADICLDASLYLTDNITNTKKRSYSDSIDPVELNRSELSDDCCRRSKLASDA